MRIRTLLAIHVFGFSTVLLPPAIGSGTFAESAADQLVERVNCITDPIVNGDQRFGLRVRAWVADTDRLSRGAMIDGDLAGSHGGDGSASTAAYVRFQRLGQDEFKLRVESRWANLLLYRSRDVTTLSTIGETRSAYRATGDTDPQDHLDPSQFLDRLLEGRAQLLLLFPAFVRNTASRLEVLEERRPGELRFRIDRSITVIVPLDQPNELWFESTARDGFFEGVRRISLTIDAETLDAESRASEEVDGGHPQSSERLSFKDLGFKDLGFKDLDFPENNRLTVDRAECERMIIRGVRRFITIHAPELMGVVEPRPRKVASGELRKAGDQNLVLLHGTPEQIGQAHGLLLDQQIRRTLDSGIYLVGLVETVRTGAWFPDVLRDAWKRLSPHIPADHLREMSALAEAVPSITLEELQLGNVFPEYFHCSGFALFGSATQDGTLYHGRVLDYMTLIGLQQASAVFIIAPENKNTFCSVGYAGFVGTVTGMNDRQISLGEIGGSGRFLWDGTPMATLMRRGLEECKTLDEVKGLFTNSPRTCEYFYVFADGKIPDAVGVSATPEQITYLAPGEGHDFLGDGIQDAVVLSAGDRLKLLRQRVIDGHGSFDTASAIRLMDRPVSMTSNLHNALMIPQEGEIWIAQAKGDTPAAERPYARFDIDALFAEAEALRAEVLKAEALKLAAKEARLSHQSYQVADTLDVGDEPDPNAKQALAGFTYDRANFEIQVSENTTTSKRGPFDALIRYPSPKPRGEAKNDLVALEWYRASGVAAPSNGEDPEHAPAVLVMHILDGKMRIARSIAKALALQGIHGFVMHMPDYGLRGDRDSRKDVTRFRERSKQGVADARRSRDVIAALPGIDPNRIGIQGTSLGGFVGTVAASLDGAFDPVYIMLAGGDLEFMMRNGQKDIAKIRKEFKKAGFAREEMIAEVTDADPLTLAHRLDPDRTWLYSARFDQVVPPECAHALGQAAGLDEEHHVWLPGNHYTCIPFLPSVLQAMSDVMLRESDNP